MYIYIHTRFFNLLLILEKRRKSHVYCHCFWSDETNSWIMCTKSIECNYYNYSSLPPGYKKDQRQHLFWPRLKCQGGTWRPEGLAIKCTFEALFLPSSSHLVMNVCKSKIFSETITFIKNPPVIEFLHISILSSLTSSHYPIISPFPIYRSTVLALMSPWNGSRISSTCWPSCDAACFKSLGPGAGKFWEAWGQYLWPKI